MHKQKSLYTANGKKHPVSSIFKWEREINIGFPFWLVPTVLCPEAGLNQGHLLKLDLGYTEPGEQVKVDSGCHA